MSEQTKNKTKDVIPESTLKAMQALDSKQTKEGQIEQIVLEGFYEGEDYYEELPVSFKNGNETKLKIYTLSQAEAFPILRKYGYKNISELNAWWNEFQKSERYDDFYVEIATAAVRDKNIFNKLRFGEHVRIGATALRLVLGNFHAK